MTRIESYRAHYVRAAENAADDWQRAMAAGMRMHAHRAAVRYQRACRAARRAGEHHRRSAVVG